MKSLIQAGALAAALVVVLATPAVSFAQSDQPVTRAEVKSDLRQLEAAGYKPEATNATYPADIEAAEARVAANNAVAQADTTGYGSTANGTSQTGTTAPMASPASQAPMNGQ
ncbi:MAG TPA: DUF4148 domain-containing protein [Paraburkholderia sp.]|jgi:hypothetical protein|nr:DUF4148 domain-containing protein [Paraburkholderia sp.]